MTERVFLAVEGVNDAAFVGRLLRTSFGLSSVTTRDSLPSAWRPLVPNQFPHEPSASISRLSVPYPVFFMGDSEDDLVAIVNGEGVDQAVEKLDTHLRRAEQEDGAARPTAVGVVVDGDNNPAARFAEAADSLMKIGLLPPSQPCCVDGSSPRVGIYVLPGSNLKGRLEDVLLDCARVVWPELTACCDRFLTDAEKLLSPKQLRKFDRDKSLTGALSAVMRPQRPLAAMISDCEWLGPAVQNRPQIHAFHGFLETLTGLARKDREAAKLTG